MKINRVISQDLNEEMGLENQGKMLSNSHSCGP